MKAFRRILVDIDPLVPHDAALRRGAELAAREGAFIKIVDVLPHVPHAARRFVTEAVEAELVADRLGRVRSAVAGLPAALEIDAETEIVRGEPAYAVAAEARRGRFDLVVRRRGRDQADPPPVFDSVDRRLVYESPCPVWLLARGPHSTPRRVLVAVDLESDQASVALARTVLEAAGQIATVYQADLTVLHAYHLNAEAMLAPYVPAAGIHDLRLDAERDARSRLTGLVGSLDFGTLTPRTALVYGEPDAVIPDYARAHGMDLVVLGTVSRSGLARLILGSTAERVLHELERSLLVVKPLQH